MRKVYAGVSAMALAALLSSACDRAPKAEEARLVPPAESPAATSGTSGTSGTSQPSRPSDMKPAEVPAPNPATSRYREVTIPAGTTLSVRLRTAIGSDTSRPEQRVDGTLARDVTIGGVEVLDSGAALRGIVTNAERSGRVKGRANVAFKFDHISANGTLYPISTRTISREAPATKKRDAATIGVPAAGGAIIGGIIGGGDAAVKGGVIGGAAGTAAVLSTRGKEVRLAPGTTVSVRLASPLTVRVPER